MCFMKGARMSVISLCIWDVKNTLSPGLFSRTTGTYISHVTSPAHGRAWAAQLATPLHDAISLHFPHLPPLLGLLWPPQPGRALPGRTPSTRTLRGLPVSLSGSSVSVLSRSFPDNISDTSYKYSLASPPSDPNKAGSSLPGSGFSDELHSLWPGCALSTWQLINHHLLSARWW